jgi:hypothetical protein
MSTAVPRRVRPGAARPGAQVAQGRAVVGSAGGAGHHVNEIHCASHYRDALVGEPNRSDGYARVVGDRVRATVVKERPGLWSQAGSRSRGYEPRKPMADIPGAFERLNVFLRA